MTLNFSEEINTDEFIFSSKLVHLTGHSMLLSKHKNVKHLNVSGNIFECTTWSKKPWSQINLDLHFGPLNY